MPGDAVMIVRKLAERFNVPLEQIAAKQGDLAMYDAGEAG
jgi:hypothetical protein